jgi:sulfide:quinone oxidoreductase
VDRHTLATKHLGVYAVGDITVIPLKMGRPLPKAGVFAHGQAEVVAHNIAREWTGKHEPRRFEGEGMCFIEAGGGRAGMGRGNFYAEPLPDVRLHQPGLLWHGAKVLYEKYWLFTKF